MEFGCLSTPIHAAVEFALERVLFKSKTPNLACRVIKPISLRTN
jgi:hypothetical protein